MVGGEIVYQDGKFTRVDRDNALRELSEILKRPLTGRREGPQASVQGRPSARRAFYDGYYNSGAHEPYYRQNSRM